MKIQSMSKANGNDIQLRVVTKRASRIFAPEPAFRKQDAAKFGQTCVEQFKVSVLTWSRSPLAIAAVSRASTSGAKAAKAMTHAPSSANITRAERDLTILDC